MDSVLKQNNYSTALSQLLPRSLKLFRALQFTGIGIFYYICGKLKISKSKISYVRLLNIISKQAIKLQDESFGYRFGEILPFHSFTVWYLSIIERVMEIFDLHIYKPNDLINLITYYVQMLHNYIQSIKSNDEGNKRQIIKLVLVEMLIIQVLFRGVPNTHQLRNKRSSPYWNLN